MNEFETLIKGKGCASEDRWYPTEVETYELREYRNRIHLSNVVDVTDHDYNAFALDLKKNDIKRKMCHTLYTILTSDIVTDSPEHFDFLKDKPELSMQ